MRHCLMDYILQKIKNFVKSIWENKITDANTATDLYISTDSGSGEYNVGDKISVNAAISPMKADQKVTWKVSNNKSNKVKVVKTEDDELQLEALKEGSVTVTATTANGLSRSIDILFQQQTMVFHLVTGNNMVVNGRSVRILTVVQEKPVETHS